MKYSALLMILGLLNLLGCIKGYQEGRLISEQRYYPKEPKFTIKPNGTDAYSNSVLDFEVIYLQKVIFNKKDYGYNYFRFWPNGRVLARLEDALPSREQAESFMGATIGYYYVSGKNLVIELYVRNPGILEWDYLTEYAIVEDNEIKEIKSVLSGRWEYYAEKPPDTYQSYSTYRSDCVFNKYKIEGLKRQPDW
jgi:hypothetical protein